MDKEVEEKLDNFEGVVSSFEEKKARGETISSEQIAILQTALSSIIAHHTIAKWWQEEMSERVNALTVHIGKFPQSEPETNSDIIATFTWDALDEDDSEYRTGLYCLKDEDIYYELNSQPFRFTIGKSDGTSLLVRVLNINADDTLFSWGSVTEQNNGLLDATGGNMTCKTAEFLKYYRLKKAD